MELLKVILDFIARVATPLVVCFSIILFRTELGLLLKRLLGILKNVEEGRQNLDLSGVKVTTSAFSETAQKVLEQDLPSATRTVQELLSPAAPLALGYAENFLARILKGEGGIQFNLIDGAESFTNVYTIYIPHELSDTEASSPDLIRAKYPGSDIQKISIKPKTEGGRMITGSAIRHKGQLLPVDVPQTMTSIRLVFKFRERQLVEKGGLTAEEVIRLETESLNEFAGLLQQRINELDMSKCVRVVRESSKLFPEDSKSN